MDKKTVAAVAVTIAFLVVWFQLVVPRFVPEPQPGQKEAPAGEAPAPAEEPAPPRVRQPLPTVTAPEVPPRETAGAPEATETAETAEKPPAPAAGAFEVPPEYSQANLEADRFTVDTEVLSFEFTTRTGSIKSVTLKDFQNFDRTGKLVLLEDFTEGLFATLIERCQDEDISDRIWRSAGEPSAGEGGIVRVSFSTVLESGLALSKTYVLYPHKYGFGLQVEVANLLDSERRVSYTLLGPAGIPSEDLGRRDVQAVLASVPAEIGLRGKMEVADRPAGSLIASDKGRMETTPARRVNFAGAANRYFAAVLRPSMEVPVESAFCDAVYDGSLDIEELEGMRAEEAREKYTPQQLKELGDFFYTAGAAFEVEATLSAAGGEGSAAVHDYLMYCGPKDKEALAAFDSEAFSTGFPALLDYGWLEPLVKLILLLLKAFHTAIPNWGVAIIILTFVMRSAMHPLMRKSQVSMAKMQKLQPQIKKLQEKYKNDKQRLGQEQMKLMKEAGANPLGGCLPMIIQLPIFFSLYRSLMLSIDLRHAPFILWIQDLAQPDRLAQLPFVLPILGTASLNLLPILMVTSMILQQRMMPRGATPEAAQQQKIMAIFMPLFIGFILYNLAAGLNLYILTSTLFGIAEQWWIRRHLASRED